MAEGWGLPQPASAYLAAGSLERSLSGGDDDEDKAGAAATQAIRFAQELSPQGESIVLRRMVAIEDDPQTLHAEVTVRDPGRVLSDA